MKTPLKEHQDTASIGSHSITNLHFADDIDGLSGKEEELVCLVKNLDDTSTRKKKQKQKNPRRIMRKGFSTKIKVSAKELKVGSQFKYLGLIISEEGFSNFFVCLRILGINSIITVPYSSIRNSTESS